MIKPPRIFTLVQNWLGLTRFETDQVLAIMSDMVDLDDLNDHQIRALAEEAFECLNKMTGFDALYPP